MGRVGTTVGCNYHIQHIRTKKVFYIEVPLTARNASVHLTHMVTGHVKESVIMLLRIKRLIFRVVHNIVNF